MEFFYGLSRSLGTKTGILLLPHTLTSRVPQYMPTTANSQKNPQFNIYLHSLFRTQPMHLHKCHLKILNKPLNISSLLKKALWNRLKSHVPKKSLEMDMCQTTPHHVDISVPNGIHCIELQCHNMSQKNNAPHWVPIVTQGCFQDN